MENKCANIVEFTKRFTLIEQMPLFSDEERCVMGDYPTLSELNVIYPSKGSSAEAWMSYILSSVSEICGAKWKLTETQTVWLAKNIVSRFGYLKVSEILLFFHLLLNKRFGAFYNSVDPMTISGALEDSFIMYRNNIEYEYRERLMNKKPSGGITAEEYCRQTGQNYEEFKKRIKIFE